jgi:transcriptional regulator with XRE-family HTH domain
MSENVLAIAPFPHPTKKIRPVPREYRDFLRHELGIHLYGLRLATAYSKCHEVTKKTKISIPTLRRLESGLSVDNITVATLCRLGTAYSRELLITIGGEEAFCDPSTLLEDLIAVGAIITYVLEG